MMCFWVLLFTVACGSTDLKTLVEAGSPAKPATPEINLQSITSLPSTANTLTPQPPKPGQRATGKAALTQAALGQASLTARVMAAIASAPTSTPSPTPELGSILSALEEVRQPEDVWTSTAPDGKWTAFGFISRPEWSESAGVLVHDINDKAWRLDPATGEVTPQE